MAVGGLLVEHDLLRKPVPTFRDARGAKTKGYRGYADYALDARTRGPLDLPGSPQRRCSSEIRPHDPVADPEAVGAARRGERLQEHDRAGRRRRRGGLSLLLADRDALL